MIGSRLVCAAAVLVAVGFVGVPGVAHAGGPSVTAEQVAQRIQAATVAANTYRLTDWIWENAGGKRLVLHQVEDVSRAPFALRAHLSIREIGGGGSVLSASGPVHLFTVVSNGRASVQINKRTPQCVSLATFTKTEKSLMAAISTAGLNPQLIGLELLSGASVWHLRESVTLHLMGKQVTIASDIYADAQTYRPVLETASSTIPVGGQELQETVRATYSRYGETVAPILPARCQGT